MDVIVTHQLPGRVRIGVKEIFHQPLHAARVQMMLTRLAGVTKVHCNPTSGRILIHFDEAVQTAENLVAILNKWSRSRASESDPTNNLTSRDLVAATSETSGFSQHLSPTPHGTSVPSAESSTLSNSYRFSTFASASLLGVLSVKHLLFSKAAFASSPTSFYISAGVSLLVGYPALRRGVEAIIRTKTLSPDLWIGLGTLATAVMRENLVALSSITLLNAVMWQRSRQCRTPENTQLDQPLQAHAQRMTKLATWITPLTLLLTRSPARTLAVALAVNPRPAILAHKYRWATAEHQFAAANFDLPGGHALETLGAAGTIVVSDVTALSTNREQWRIRSLVKTVQPRQIISLAASLLHSQNQFSISRPLRKIALQERCTLHRAVQLEKKAAGIRGMIQGHLVSVGTKEYAEQHGIDVTPILLEERRLRRDGFSPYIVAKDQRIVGIIGAKPVFNPKWVELFEHWRQQGYDIRVLSPPSSLAYPFTSMSQFEYEDIVRNNKPFIFVTDKKEVSPANKSMIVILPTELNTLQRALELCHLVRSQITRDTNLVKTWNLLGLGLALFSPVTAPILNLTGDAVGLALLLKRTKFQKQLAGTASAGPASASITA